MELLQSLITTNTPGFINFFKYWLIKLLQASIDILLTYPINLILLSSLIFYFAYKVSFRMFGSKQFKQTYKPLQHNANFIDDIKSMKKEMRQMQTQIIEIKKKMLQQNNEQNHQQEQNSNKNDDEETQILEDKQLQQMGRIFEAKTQQHSQNNQFNKQLQSELKMSMGQMLNTLKKLNVP